MARWLMCASDSIAWCHNHGVSSRRDWWKRRFRLFLVCDVSVLVSLGLGCWLQVVPTQREVLAHFPFSVRSADYFHVADLQ